MGLPWAVTSPGPQMLSHPPSLAAWLRAEYERDHFHTVHGVLKARILKWFATPFPSGPHFVRTLHLPGLPQSMGLRSWTRLSDWTDERDHKAKSLSSTRGESFKAQRFFLERRKCSRIRVVTAKQHWEYNTCYWIIHFKMINFVTQTSPQ